MTSRLLSTLSSILVVALALAAPGGARAQSGFQGSSRSSSFSPKFQGVSKGVPIAGNDLCRSGFPVSGYILINRSASACSASASVTW